jgi:acyl carrier protein
MKNKIIEILTEIRPEFNFNIESKNFFSEGILDSFDIISIVSDLEDAFDFEIDGAKILPENFDSIEAIFSLITENNQ